MALADPVRGAPADPVQLELHARLFHSRSAHFSDDVMAPGARDLWNVVASDDPSTATLVVVAVKLAADTVLRSETPVHLVVREDASRGKAQRVVLDRTLRVGAVPRGGITHLAVLLPDTGCRTLHIQATLAKTDATPMTSAAGIVPFACGE